jgi:fructokinase
MLAFVSLRADGEREFMFYRHPSADMLLSPEEIDRDYIAAARLLHHGSISLIDEPSRSATLAAIAAARDHGRLISYDPNLRPALWPSADAARRGILEAWPFANLIKVSQEELEFLSGEQDPRAATRRLWHDRLRLMVVTGGAQGCWYFTPAVHGHVAGYRVVSVDATGAGDAFVAGLLAGLLSNEAAWESVPDLEKVLRFANAVGALTTTRRGAIPALPTQAQVLELLRQAGNGIPAYD